MGRSCERHDGIDLFGGPYGNRTCNLLIKSQLLCLVELTAHRVDAF